MSLQVAVLAGLLHITAPATLAPEQYLATAFALPGQQLQWRGWDNWVAPHLCFERCGTVPGQDNVLLAGGLSLQDAADVQLTVWRLDAGRWVQVMHCANFFTGPYCGPLGPMMPIFMYALIAAGLFLGGFATGWEAQDNRAQVKIGQMKVDASKKDADHQAAVTKAAETARLAEQALAANYQGALNEATKREVALRTDLDAARRTAGGLRSTIDAIRAEVAGYSQPAAAATASTAADLLGICTEEYRGLAEAADRHAADSLMLLQAWPKSHGP